MLLCFSTPGAGMAGVGTMGYPPKDNRSAGPTETITDPRLAYLASFSTSLFTEDDPNGVLHAKKPLDTIT